MNNPWTRDDNGSMVEYVAEISSFDMGRIDCPHCGKHVSPANSRPHRDNEGDVTHWVNLHPCGARLVLLND